MDEADADGGAPQGNVETNPKCILNSFVMRYVGKPVVKGDIIYETVASPSGNGFASMLQLPTVGAKEGASETPEFVGDDCETEKLAEQSAAQKALDHYADWIAANPPPPRDPNKLPKKKNKLPNKRKGEDDFDGPADTSKFHKPEDYKLKFVDGPERDEEAASRKSLNNQPAWMSRGLGVNKDLFGESKGNLVKPGMYEDDLAKIEAKKGNPLGDGPDPFGDVFNERHSGGNASGAPNPWRTRRPLPSQDDHFAGNRPAPVQEVAKPVPTQAARIEKPLDAWSLL